MQYSVTSFLVFVAVLFGLYLGILVAIGRSLYESSSQAAEPKTQKGRAQLLTDFSDNLERCWTCRSKFSFHIEPHVDERGSRSGDR